MPRYNVLAAVGEVIDADNPEDAKRALTAALRSAGFDIPAAPVAEAAEVKGLEHEISIDAQRTGDRWPEGGPIPEYCAFCVCGWKGEWHWASDFTGATDPDTAAQLAASTEGWTHVQEAAEAKYATP